MCRERERQRESLKVIKTQMEKKYRPKPAVNFSSVSNMCEKKGTKRESKNLRFINGLEWIACQE